MSHDLSFACGMVWGVLMVIVAIIILACSGNDRRRKP